MTEMSLCDVMLEFVSMCSYAEAFKTLVILIKEYKIGPDELIKALTNERRKIWSLELARFIVTNPKTVNQLKREAMRMRKTEKGQEIIEDFKKFARAWGY